MTITAAKIKEVNERLETIDQKGKAYVMVNERVKGFRQILAGGCISTEFLVLDFENGVAVCKATITDEQGMILATGTAYEREGAGFVNKTSFIENCETSAVGRALGMLGIGIDSSMASAEEVANAMKQQKELATDVEKKTFVQMCEKKGVNPEDVLRSVGWKSGSMTKAHHGLALQKLMEMPDA